MSPTGYGYCTVRSKYWRVASLVYLTKQKKLKNNEYKN